MVPWISLIPFEIYVLFIAVFFCSLKEIRSLHVNSLNRRLLILFFIGLAVRMSVLHTHLIYLDEPAYGVVAKNMLLHNKAAQDFYLADYIGFKSTKTYPGWSFMLAIAYFFFGVSDKVAINLTAFIGSLTIFLVFTLSKRLFRKDSIALWSSLIFALLPLHVIWSAASDTIIFGIFLILLLFIIKDKLLAAVLLAFTVQTRPDYIFLLPILLFYWFLFDRIKINVFLVLIPVIPFYLHSLSSIPYSTQTGTYLDILSFTDTQSIAMLVILFIGSYALLRHKKAFLFLFSLYIIPTIFYLAWGGLMNSKVLLLNYLCFVMIQGVGVSSLAKDKIIRSLFFIFIVSSSVFLINKHYINMEGDYQILSTIVPGRIDTRIMTGCYIIAVEEDAMILSAGSMARTMHLTYDLLNNADKFLKGFNGRCVLYYEGMYCTSLKRPECQAVHKTLDLKKLQSFSYGEADYLLYSINGVISS